MATKKLYKDVANKKISGVCAGIADYFDIDVTLIRLGWVFFSFFTTFFPGLILYIVCACIMEPKPTEFQGNGTYSGGVNNYSNATYQQPSQAPQQAPQQPQQPIYNPNDYQQPPQNQI